MAALGDPLHHAPGRRSVGVEARWSLRLLGAVTAASTTQTLSRWPSRAVAALLARLALAPDRAHSREELVELLWPGVSLDVGRNRLRQALSSLKSLLEPVGSISAPVLFADRSTVRMLPDVVACDALQFEQLLRGGHPEAARALYRGELMPGFFDEWVVDERHRLSALFDRLGPLPEMPAAAPPAAAPAAPMAAPLTGLPNYWTRSFGVELPASRLVALVQTQRLVTVHGPGGSGKTRLAAEVAQALREGPGWQVDEHALPFTRVCFVPLLACGDAAAALDVISQALSADGREGDPRSRIITALSGWRTLLVLDNLEQLGDEIGHEVARCLAALPGLHVLATSRRLLAIDGEVAFELEGLPLPRSEAGLAEVVANPAVALFVDRARSARASFNLGPRNVADVVALVQLVAGMPLAIELAASRVRSLTPHELLQRLREDAGTPMLDLLARGAHRRVSLQARHASMRHVMAWSWLQLSPAQAQMLHHMSVLAAPAGVQMVAALLASDALETQLLLDTLHDVSLVHTTVGSDEVTRYQVLQPVREFAGERLAADEALVARQRLRRWLIDFAIASAKAGPAVIASELAHVHSAIVSAAAQGSLGALRESLQLAVALHMFWETDAMPLSLVVALEHALAELTRADDAGDTGLCADALNLLALARGAATNAAQALAHARAGLVAASDDRRRALALARWVWASYLGGNMDGDAFDTALQEAALLAQRAADPAALATVTRLQAMVASNIRLDMVRAAALSAQTLELWQTVGNRPMEQMALLNLAATWAWSDRVEDSIAASLQCERAMQADGNWAGQITVARQLGRVYVRERRWAEGEAAFRRSARLAWQRQYAFGIAHALLHLPDAMVMGAQPEVAARLHGFAIAHWDRVYGRLNRIEAAEMRRTRRMLRMRLGGTRAQALMGQGCGMGLHEAAAIALPDPGEAATRPPLKAPA